MQKKDTFIFVSKILLLALPIVLVSAYLEHKLYQIPNSYNLKRTNFEHQLESIQTLILGSSHALNAINPAYLSTPTYNLANVSQSLDYDQLLTLKYLPQLPR